MIPGQHYTSFEAKLLSFQKTPEKMLVQGMKKYGDIFRLSIKNENLVVVNHPEYINNLFYRLQQNEDVVYGLRFDFGSLSELLSLNGNHVFDLNISWSENFRFLYESTTDENSEGINRDQKSFTETGIAFARYAMDFLWQSDDQDYDWQSILEAFLEVGESVLFNDKNYGFTRFNRFEKLVPAIHQQLMKKSRNGKNESANVFRSMPAEIGFAFVKQQLLAMLVSAECLQRLFDGGQMEMAVSAILNNEEEDLDNLIREYFRLYPVFHAYVIRSKDRYEIGSFEIQKNDLIMISPSLFHHDPRYYTLPKTFLPERWNTECKLSYDGLLFSPFGYRGFDAGLEKTIKSFIKLSIQNIAIKNQNYKKEENAYHLQ